MLGRYFNAYNEIDNQNMIRKSDIMLEEYWVTRSGYFRIATPLVLGMVITDGNILSCRKISQDCEYKTI